MRTAKHWILLNITLALLAVATEGEAQNAPPASAGWHSLTAQGGRAAPIAIDQRTCFARAQQALQTLGFYDLALQGGWALTGVRGSLKANIHCVAMGNGSMIDVAVAAPAGFAGQTAQVRDALRDAMLGSAGSSGTPPPGLDPRGGGADAYARLYADLATTIAEVGRTQLGWADGLDPRGPPNDQGRGALELAGPL